MSHQKGQVKELGIEMKFEDDLAGNFGLMLESDELLGLVEERAPWKREFQDHCMVYGVSKHRGNMVADLG